MRLCKERGIRQLTAYPMLRNDGIEIIFPQLPVEHLRDLVESPIYAKILYDESGGMLIALAIDTTDNKPFLSIGCLSDPRRYPTPPISSIERIFEMPVTFKVLDTESQMEEIIRYALLSQKITIEFRKHYLELAGNPPNDNKTFECMAAWKSTPIEQWLSGMELCAPLAKVTNLH